jgi:hypothetical protein
MRTWEDAQGKIWVSYNGPVYLLQRHGLPGGIDAKHCRNREAREQGG